jgi:uncharacterized protein
MVNVDEGIYAIMNSYTHAFDIVNSNVYEFLKNNKQTNIAENTLKKLEKRGYLTSLSENEELTLVKKITDEIHEKKRFNLYNFQFLISYECNFRCGYCYEKDVLNANGHSSKQRITKDQVDKAFEFIDEKYNKKQCARLLSLYGGEPFLAENKNIVSYIIEKGLKYGFIFYAPSNGYDLDHYFDVLKENPKKFSFQITLDGVEDIQNVNRPHYKNGNSFEKIVENIDQLLEIGIGIKVRINVDAESLKRINELLQFFESKGWYKYKNFSAYWALLRNDVIYQKKGQKQLTQADLVKAFQEKTGNEGTTSQMGCQDYGVYTTLKNIILGKNIPYKGYFCGAQTNAIIFDPIGDIYSCWDVVGQKQYRIGCYIPEFKIDNDAYKLWFDDKISHYKCSKCKYVLFCGGGCIIRSLREKNKIEPGNCNHYSQLFNCLIKSIYNETIKENYNQLI